MKTLKTRIILLLIMGTVMAMGSCTKVKESPDPANSSSSGSGGGGSGGSGGGGNGGGSSSQHFTCLVDGGTFEALTISGDLVGGSLILSGYSGSAKFTYPAVQLSVPEDVNPGSYSTMILYMTGSGLDETWSGVSGGSLEITSHDKTNKKITGTFSGKVDNFSTGTSKDISSGSFAVTY